jgi:hypothetical protein
VDVSSQCDTEKIKSNVLSMVLLEQWATVVLAKYTFRRFGVKLKTFLTIQND